MFICILLNVCSLGEFVRMLCFVNRERERHGGSLRCASVADMLLFWNLVSELISFSFFRFHFALTSYNLSLIFNVRSNLHFAWVDESLRLFLVELRLGFFDQHVNGKHASM